MPPACVFHPASSTDAQLANYRQCKEQVEDYILVVHTYKNYCSCIWCSTIQGYTLYGIDLCASQSIQHGYYSSPTRLHMFSSGNISGNSIAPNMTNSIQGEGCLPKYHGVRPMYDLRSWPVPTNSPPSLSAAQPDINAFTPALQLWLQVL